MHTPSNEKINAYTVSIITHGQVRACFYVSPLFVSRRTYFRKRKRRTENKSIRRKRMYVRRWLKNNLHSRESNSTRVYIHIYIYIFILAGALADGWRRQERIRMQDALSCHTCMYDSINPNKSEIIFAHIILSQCTLIRSSHVCTTQLHTCQKN